MTLYKVVPDQLRISQGWVKCGQCGDIFDASQHLLEAATEDEAPDASLPEPPVEPSTQTGASATAASDPVLSASGHPFPPGADATIPTPTGDLDTGQSECSDEAPEPELALEFGAWQTPQPDSAPAAELPQPSSAPLAVMDAELEAAASSPMGNVSSAEEDTERDEAHERVALVWPPMPADTSVAEPATLDAGAAAAERDGAETALLAYQPGLDMPEPAQQAFDRGGDLSHLAPPAQTPDALAPSFMRDAGRRPAWQRPLVRAGLSFLALLLAVGLGLQWVVQAHDRLAAAQPTLTPALQRLCQLAGCVVAPLQQIESIAIDAAAFSKIRADHYRLSFTLKNAAPLALALPSIELTLTDAQDHAVIRRVLSPQELAAPATLLPAASEQALSVQLQVTPPTASPPIVGYRLLAFYP